MDSRRSCIRTARRGDRLCKYYASGAIVRSTCVYVPRAAYANTQCMQISAVDLMRARSHACFSRPVAGSFVSFHFISRFRNYRSQSHYSTSVIYLRISVRVSLYIFRLKQRDVKTLCCIIFFFLYRNKVCEKKSDFFNQFCLI